MPKLAEAVFVFHCQCRLTVATVAVIIMAAPASGETVISDQQALQITKKYCVSCHATKPADARFSQPPKNMVLETVAELRKFAEPIYRQTVENRSMPLGNPAVMPEIDRATLGRWLKAKR